jgi:hypothetical protein
LADSGSVQEEAPRDSRAAPSGQETPRQTPSDFLAAALDSEVSDADLATVDVELDSMGLNETLAASGSGDDLISLEEARAKLPPEVLEALAAKFKGSPTQVRQRDERDQLF